MDGSGCYRSWRGYETASTGGGLGRLKQLSRQHLPRVLGGISLLIAAWYVQSIGPGQDTSVAAVATQQALILQRDIPPGQAVAEADIRVVPLHADHLPPNALRVGQWPRMSGLVSRLPLGQGQVLTLNDFTQPKGRLDPAWNGAQLWVPKQSVAGVEHAGAVQGHFNLHGLHDHIQQALLIPKGDGWLIRVPSDMAPTLARLARQPIQAVLCRQRQCPVADPKPVEVVKTQKPAQPKRRATPTHALQISYGVKP